jgi:hypothetical protein
MLKFPAETEKLEEITPQFHCFYEQRDNKYVLSSSPQVVAAVESLNGIQGALGNARKEADTLKTAVAALNPLKSLFGDNMAEWGTAIPKKLTGLESQLAEKHKFDPEEAKKSIREAMQGELAAKDKTIEQMQSSLQEHLLVGSATAALAAAGAVVDPDSGTALAMPHVLARLRMVKDDAGKFQVVVTEGSASDPNAKPVWSKQRPGEPMNVQEFVAEMSKQPGKAPLFKSTAGSGGGSSRDQQRHSAGIVGQQGGELSAKAKRQQGLAQMRQQVQGAAGR